MVPRSQTISMRMVESLVFNLLCKRIQIAKPPMRFMDFDERTTFFALI